MSDSYFIEFISRFTILIVLSISFYLFAPTIKLALLLSIILLVFFFDLKTILTFKNFIIIYMFVLFVIAGMLYYENSEITSQLMVDFIIYSISLFVGYNFFLLLPKQKRNIIHKFDDNLYKLKVKLEKIILLLIFINYFFLFVTIISEGIVDFYTGKYLVKKIFTYGQKNIIEGLKQILNYIAFYFSVAISIFYISICYSSHLRPRIEYIIIQFIIFPLLSLSRGIFLNGVMFIIISQFIFKGKISVMKIFLFAILVLLIAVFFGIIRELALLSFSVYYNDLEEILERFVKGEFSQIIAYAEIKNNISQLNYQYGKTILLPLLTKLIPRSIFPDKPFNSAGYFMYMIYPESAKFGFFLAPTIFGSIFLNFGYVGCIILSFSIGILAAYFDYLIKLIIKKNITNILKVALVILIFMNLYNILRNDIVESFFLNFTIYIFILIIKRFFKRYFATA